MLARVCACTLSSFAPSSQHAEATPVFGLCHSSVRLGIILAHEEAVYYEIDKLFNQLMALNLEIKAATER